MKCPSCGDGETLVMADRQGIEIDYCPKCRGVWLDRGELDKLIERSGAQAAGPAARETAPFAGRESGRYEVPERRYADARGYRRDDDDDDYHDGRDGYGRGRRKRRSFLDDLFDFG
jgi:Zn-finger nucleic acid-binding protein